MENVQHHFSSFRKNIIGINQKFHSPYGEQTILYADWTASGRLYEPIEQRLREKFFPFVGNTHSESSVTGTAMTKAYHRAHEIIKRHVHAGKNDVLLNIGSGMTSAVNKFQRMLGMKIPESLSHYVSLPKEMRPVVFVTHMEHHSNQTTWEETIADVVVIKATAEGLVDVNDLRFLLDQYTERKIKIGSFTACSNVTGIATPYHALAKIMHEHGGLCFVDFAASAPYVHIDMHPADPLEQLDAIFFSPHKFLGGPGTSGVLIFDSTLYHLKTPEQPGGGTVLWTNPWGGHRYYSDIELREDGGTPAFLQTIKSALCVQLKEKMDVEKIHAREKELVRKMFAGLRSIPRVHILADAIEDRLGIFSFYADDIHYNLIVRLLNDRFGIQTRGGWSCAGTYGLYLLHVDRYTSNRITDKINHGDLSEKPGWVRASLHPTTTDEEAEYILHAIEQIIKNIDAWQKEYRYDNTCNEFFHLQENGILGKEIESWFF